MPKLRVHIKKTVIRRPKKLILLIDSKEVGYFESQDKIEIDIPFGNHNIQVKSPNLSSNTQKFTMDLKKEIEISVKFDILTKTVLCVNAFAILMSAFFYIKFLYVFSIPLTIYYLITLFIKRKDFFIIKELN